MREPSIKNLFRCKKTSVEGGTTRRSSGPSGPCEKEVVEKNFTHAESD